MYFLYVNKLCNVYIDMNNSSPDCLCGRLTVQVQLGPRYEGQLNHMAEPIPQPVRLLVRPHDTHHYPTAEGRAETDRFG